jgi:hypothetical protein
MIFERYGKVKKRVGSQLAISHQWKLDVTKRTILTPVTATRDYNFYNPAFDPVPVTPSDPDKQAFSRRFGQGHLTPAAVRETARKKKRKEPNAKQKLLLVDGQPRIFDYISPTSDSATKMLDFTPGGSRRTLLPAKSDASKSCATVVEIPGKSTRAPSCRHSTKTAPQSLTSTTASSENTVGPASLIGLTKPAASVLGWSPLTKAIVPQPVSSASLPPSSTASSFASSEDPHQFSFDPDPNASFEPVFGNFSDDSDPDTQEGRYNTPTRGE